MEAWKDIDETDGLYQISNQGQVRSLKYNSIRILATSITNAGYKQVLVRGISRLIHVRVHRMVAEKFILNPENKRTVNHKNGIKTDNRVENLEWSTYSENQQHAVDTGLNVSLNGERHGRAKLKNADVLAIRQMISQGLKDRIISDKFNIHYGIVYRIRIGIQWTSVK